MDVRLSVEQRALRDAAALAVDQLGPRTVGDLDDNDRVAKLDAAIAATGWRELRVPAEDTTPLASGVEVAIVAEEFGRGLADTAYLGPTLAAELRRLADAPPPAAPGETIVLTTDLIGLASGDAPLAPGAVAVDAHGAETALALLPAPGGHTVAQVVLPAAATHADLTRPAATLGPATEASPLADQSRVVTTEALTRLTAFGLAITCADLVGSMRGALQLACNYAKQREQYGVAVGSFQAVQHLLADALVATEGSASVALHAAWAADALTPREALAAAAVAKAYCTRAALSVCEVTIQVHGGIGNTWECLAHVYLRRALLSNDMFGGVGPNLARVLDANGIGDTRGLR